MPWILAATALAFCGIAVLGLLGARVYRETVLLSRQIAAGARDLERATERFVRTAEPLASRAGSAARR